MRIAYPEDLPVSARREDILAALRDNQVVVVAGETGSGKTTQLPKMCLELGRGSDRLIGHTQPRRIAARTVAERLAEELGVRLGGAVGYAVRFDDRVGDKTMVKVMTDGILLAEIRRDPLLEAYDTVIVDEAHERSLNIDFLLGYLTRLLPRRPDLKLVITSATIDTARFAAHFSAPAVEVSGRTYPVEVRYRPVREEDGDAGRPGADGGTGGAGDRDRDINQAICDAVRELMADQPGDILVFLPGERDIRDAADALHQSFLGTPGAPGPLGGGTGGTGRRGPPPEGLEILPLYARLSAAEQHRAFRPHRGRRVVLATNVAETSLTVPGIRSVVDTGLARVSRFSHRTKVQRLPIEPVSRASADQRAGRCGRIAPGVCIRLYSEEDYLARPEFTDPEILRTNLASVVLQMAAIGLGEVEDFPFIEPPDRRAVADGRSLLEEIGAFERTGEDGWRLTRIGRRLADLPVDPRLGRMIVEAERLGCLKEVTVIAAAMSIQDPRERPSDAAAEADEMHRRFEVPDSDFLGYLRLWDYLVEVQESMSGNQFRRRCRAEHLNVLRVREWQDLAGQIRRAYRSRGVHAAAEPAPAEAVHRALLPGLLSHIGMRDRVRGDYLGARSTRWQIGRGSALARRQPAWAVAGTLVETERTWARTVARIEPSWAERAGAHLLKRSFGEPWWDPGRGEALTEERATLYGLPVVANRRSTLARLDPAEARRLFIEHALVGRDWPVAVAPLERTEAKMRQIAAVEERTRRAGLLAGPAVRAAAYERVLPTHVTGGRSFLRWWRRTEASAPDLLDIPLSDLLDRHGGPVDLAGYPDTWRQGELELDLHYRYEPGAADDGVTVVVPLLALNRVAAAGFDWNVPGYRPELVSALVRSLPKPVRRELGPAPQVAREVLSGWGPGDGPLLETVAAALTRLSGQPVPPGAWRLEDLPAHLRMGFEVVDTDGTVLRRSHDLGELRAGLMPRVRAAMATAFSDLERHGETGWVFGDLPRVVRRGGLVAYPSLTDQGQSVGCTVLETPEAQARSMWAATRRLLLLAHPLPVRHLERRLTNETRLALARSSMGFADLLDDCAAAVADQIIVSHGGPAFTRSGFEAMGADAGEMADRVARVATIAGGVMAAAELVEGRVDRLEAGDAGRQAAAGDMGRQAAAGGRRRAAGGTGRAVADLRRQIGRLVYPGFVSDQGTSRLRDLLRYLDAAGRRVALLPGDARRDGQRQDVVDRVEQRYERLLHEASRAGTVPAALSEIRWMIEELRVSLWAQTLGTSQPVSEARIMRALDRIEG